MRESSPSACAAPASGAKSCGGGFDFAGLEARLAALDVQASRPDLWNDREAAEKLLREKRSVEREV